MKLRSFALTPYPTPLLFFLITSLCTASRFEHLEQATKASLRFTNVSNSFHCKCFKTCHVPHQTAPFASIIMKSTPGKIIYAACLIHTGNNLIDVNCQ